MVLDVVIFFDDDTVDYKGELRLRCEKMSYNIDRRIKIYELPIFKALSQALDGDVWQPWATDWGQSVESFELDGVINEGNKYDSMKKMMEISNDVRVKGYNAARTLLFIGADPSDPSDLEKYAVNEDGSRIGPTVGEGLEGKINKISFEHVGNTPAIMFKIQYIVCSDFGMTE